MTKPRQPTGRATGSQERRDTSEAAWSSADAWFVNSNNGNTDYNDRNNRAWLRVCRSVSPVAAGECQGAESVPLRGLYDAWRAARRNKAPSGNQMAFETRWMEHLITLQEELAGGTWAPSPTTCFIAQRPKARQIHAPDFRDRIAHHWLIPKLDALYEPAFIFDSYANRTGKGTHAAVRRLQQFARQVESGEGGGWYMQLDIANFFPSIHRETLYADLKRRMQRAGTPMVIQRAVHALLRQSVEQQGVIHRSTAEERARVPLHKRLENAPRGCGIAIGNLSSQFFANVYLNPLDHFVKRTLGVRRYLHYVDDFVLIHRDRAQLERWYAQIVDFLRTTLRLELKDDVRIRPLSTGVDFLGYVVRPSHTLVRRRVVAHARAALANWEREHVRDGLFLGRPQDFERIRSVWASYEGHYRHANAWRLRAQFHRRFRWLHAAVSPRRFSPTLAGVTLRIRSGACK